MMQFWIFGKYLYVM